MRARTTPRWIPLLLILHVALLPVSSILPHAVQSVTVLIMAVGFAGIAITANSADVKLSFER